MALMPSMGKQIRRARLDAGLSKARFAQLVGVGRRAPIRWEQNASKPQAENLARIVAVTGKDIGFFFSEDEDEEGELAALRRRTETLVALLADARTMADDLLREVEHLREREEVTA